MIRCGSWWASGEPSPETSVWNKLSKAVTLKIEENGGIDNTDILKCLWDDEETRKLLIGHTLKSVTKNDFVHEFPFNGKMEKELPISLTVITTHVLGGNTECTNNYNMFQCVTSTKCLPNWLKCYIQIIVSRHPRISNTVARLRGDTDNMVGIWARDVCGLGAAELNFSDRVDFLAALSDSTSEITSASNSDLCDTILTMATALGVSTCVDSSLEKMDKQAFDELPIRELKHKHILHYCDEVENALVAYTKREHMERTLREVMTNAKPAMLSSGIFLAPVLSIVFNMTANWDTVSTK